MQEKISVFLKHSGKFIGYMSSKENNFKRSYNLIRAVINWKIFKPLKLKTYPITLTICTGNICNLSCELCPIGLKQKGRNAGFLKFNDFKKIIDEVGGYLYELYLYNWGEPFMNKDIFKMIKYAKKKNIKVVISSNLLMFNENLAREIIESELDHLIVSLDGASNGSVRRYQKGNNFEKVFSNMLKLIKLKEEMNRKKPFIEWRFMVNKYNENEIEKAKKLASRIDKVSFETMLPNMANYVLKNERENFKEFRGWMPKNQKYSMFDENGRNKEHQEGCRWLWLMSSINWNGSVSPCCSIWFEKFDFGNCFERSFKEVWNNENYQNARRAIKGERIDKLNICEICKKNKSQI